MQILLQISNITYDIILDLIYFLKTYQTIIELYEFILTEILLIQVNSFRTIKRLKGF